MSLHTLQLKGSGQCKPASHAVHVGGFKSRKLMPCICSHSPACIQQSRLSPCSWQCTCRHDATLTQRKPCSSSVAVSWKPYKW